MNGRRAAINPATGLTPKEADFAFQVVRLGDPNKAYRLAYDAGGMLPSSVRAAVTRLLQKPRIAERIGELQTVADSKLEVTIERIARETARIAFVDFGELFDDEGRPIPIHLLPVDLRHAVESVTVVERKGMMAVGVKMTPQAGAEAKALEEAAGKKAKKAKAQKSVEKQDNDQAMANVTGIDFVPVRERKITLHGKLKALELLMRWKKMISDRSDEVTDPNDVRNLTDEALEEEIRANAATLELIERSRKRGEKAVKAKAEAQAGKVA